VEIHDDATNTSPHREFPLRDCSIV